MQLIEFPDAETLLMAGVTVLLPEVLEGPVPRISTRVPSPRPGEFILILRTGGVARDFYTDVPQITVEAWAKTETRAQLLAQKVRTVLRGLHEIGGYAIYDVEEFAGPANLPDSLSGQPRYTATYAIPIRGRAV